MTRNYFEKISNHPAFRGWLERHRASQPSPNQYICLGEGPLPPQIFDSFMKCLGWRQQFVEDAYEVGTVVVGQHKVAMEDLREIVAMRRGSTLKIYSQEMIVAWISTGEDPFDGNSCHVESFAEDHQILQSLARGIRLDDEVGIAWPATNVSRGIRTSARWFPDAPEEGFLQHFGYHVGESGNAQSERCDALRRLFNADLTVEADVFEDTYIRDWGDPKSPPRLQKLANTIAALCRNAKKKREVPRTAVSEWEDDLRWLRNEFWASGWFQWPNTEVV